MSGNSNRRADTKSTARAAKQFCRRSLLARLAAGTAAPLAPALLSSASRAAAQDLRILIWSGYMPKSLKHSFESRTGINVKVETYESNRELLTKLKASGETKPAEATAERVAELRRDLMAALSPRDAAFKRILDRVSESLPDDGMVFTDMTQIAYFGNRFYPAERPGTWFHPVGFGTLGYALPAAVGAKLAVPERATVALAGDGGLMFTLQELATAVELSLPIPLLLWNNEAYGQILDGMVKRQIPPIGVRPRNPRFQALAAAFDCAAEQPADLAAFKAAVAAALARKGPTLIELREGDFVT